MSSVSVQEAQSRLRELIEGLKPGDEVVITADDVPVATLARTAPRGSWPCRAGSAKGKIRIASNFDEPCLTTPHRNGRIEFRAVDPNTTRAQHGGNAVR